MQPIGFFIEWRGVYCSVFYSLFLYKILIFSILY
nr:MAG TPA: hypothetical protein [Caudoviricetes sp.]DAW51502.1 MAG TPA: hypothetical protein [Caudoviricetes sp.]